MRSLLPENKLLLESWYRSPPDVLLATMLLLSVTQPPRVLAMPPPL